MTRLADAFASLAESLDRYAGARFAPGWDEHEVRRTLDVMGVAHPGDDVVEWFTLQGGIEPDSTRLPFGFCPIGLAELADFWEQWLAMMADVRDGFDFEVAEFDFWPKAGWCPIDAGDGLFVIETEHGSRPGRVIRRYDDAIEVWAPSIEMFVSVIDDVMRQGIVGPVSVSLGSDGVEWRDGHVVIVS